LSIPYSKVATASCLRLFAQEIDKVFSLALFNAGNSSAARMAMMEITTSSSINVKIQSRHKLET